MQNIANANRSDSMGLSHAPDYKWTDHFAQRALERFDVDHARLAKWVARQIGTLTLYSDETATQPEVKKYVTDDGIIFVCNTIELIFVTCYEANDLIAEGKKVTIHENNVDLFNEEVSKLARRYRLKDSQEMLLSVTAHIDEFYKLSHRLMKGRLTEKNYLLIQSLIDEFHAVRSAMRVIESKRSDFKVYKG
ncbi:hypothetical protein [Staphylococcus microti]|nr:hypothetical protein [Staphylococcus microti]